MNALIYILHYLGPVFHPVGREDQPQGAEGAHQEARTPQHFAGIPHKTNQE